MASFRLAASPSASSIIPPQVALYPPAKIPYVTEKNTRSTMLQGNGRPHNRNADSEELTPDMTARMPVAAEMPVQIPRVLRNPNLSNNARNKNWHTEPMTFLQDRSTAYATALLRSSKHSPKLRVNGL
ncbi:hypothetical protein ACRE_022960 [Hapsidospora chrysogenum ATCC 11550]|uniref:Uncharacterized protein n=1 Tax=Hapsidospora chrysogenum (strain ATCC 11550 / CBS 779.69 / DSM 880 / IAM 14645 / JCM 23072 / IMI 49137) TaxID=857340 RepID=A0A086TC30_HAPC1|nr:hypothetical protein ACRE_022960 [Hapsidospora chrysogenum ATCC 11550]